MVEKNTDRLWFTVGAVIVGAIIIFMFRDNVGTTVSKLFDRFNVDIDDVVGKSDNINFEGDVKDGYIVAQLRSAYTTDDKYYGPIWGQYKIESDDEVSLFKVAGSKEYLLNNWDDVTSSNLDPELATISGDLFFPNTINGKSLTSISGSELGATKLDGSFSGGNLRTIPDGYLSSLMFKGTFDAGAIEVVDSYAFSSARFTGEFDSKNIKSIGVAAFEDSNFTGDFQGNDIKSIGGLAFSSSIFTGDFHLGNIESLEYSAFGSDASSKNTFGGNFYGGDSKATVTSKIRFNDKVVTFKDFIPENMTSVPNNMFDMVKFTGEFNAGKLVNIGDGAFAGSGFSKQTLDLKNIASIGTMAFRAAKFTGDLDLRSVTSLGTTPFYDVPFTGDLHLGSVNNSTWGALSSGTKVFGGDLYLDDSNGIYSGYGTVFKNVYANKGNAFSSKGVGVSAVEITGTLFFEDTKTIEKALPMIGIPYLVDLGQVTHINARLNGNFKGVLDLTNVEYIIPGSGGTYANFDSVNNPKGITVPTNTIKLPDGSFYSHD